MNPSPRFRLSLLLALVPGLAAAQFPILAGDPVDPSTGQAYTIFPGLPLIVPPSHGDPVVIDGTKIGDVDLVVRAGSPMVGPTIPPPATSPPTAVAGAVHLAAGNEIPFRIIASDGSATPAAGNPLPGRELNGIPGVVFVFADLDGDGFIGPTGADAAGTLDDGRELQEAFFPIGRQVALFENGVASGTVAVSAGAPASAGGLTVLLTAAAYIGPFDGFMNDNVPHGPAVATMFPFLPKLDPDRVVDGDGAGGRAGSAVRIELVLEPDIDLPFEDPRLDAPFAIRTDGSSVTVDRAVVFSGAFARAGFVRPSDPSDFPLVGHDAVQSPLHRDAGGTLVAPLRAITLSDDGPGNPAAVRLVPLDRLDDVTDPPPGTAVTLLAGAGVAIAAPDTDGDPSRETVSLATAAGMVLAIDDAGLAGDGAGDSAVDVVAGGYVVDSLLVHLTPAGAGTTTTTVAGATTSTSVPPVSTTVPATSTTTTTLPGCGAGATFDSIGCRLAALELALRHDVPAGVLADRLLRASDRGRAALAAAATADPIVARRQMRREARTAARQLGRIRTQLRSRLARRQIDPDALARATTAIQQLVADLKTLRATL